MKLKKELFKVILPGLMLLFITQACVGKQEKVPLISSSEDQISCQEVISRGMNTVSDNELNQALENAVSEHHTDCWRLLVQKALEEDRDIKMCHLARAVNVFNKNKTEKLFSLATYRYFVEIARGNGRYGVKDQKLMQAWLSFEIRRAEAKTDKRLIRVKRVCQRLDNHLYQKFFF